MGHDKPLTGCPLFRGTSHYYQLITTDPYYYSSAFRVNTPKSQHAASTRGELTIGSVTGSAIPGFRYRLTNPYHINRLVISTTQTSGASCSPGSGAVRPPTNSRCRYYTKKVMNLITHAPYTTGRVQVWQPNGNTNTVQTTTGYDNRTVAGLNGIISLVQPRLAHTYVTARSVIPNAPIEMSRSSARTRRIDFRMMPEPTGVATLAAGFVTLAGLYRRRRHSVER